MQVQAIFCNQIQYWVFRIYVRARILKFLSKPSPTPIYYPQVFASALSRNSSDKAITFLRACRAHPLARWFAGRSPTGNRPATHSRQSPVSDWLGPIKARPHTFVKFTWHPNRPSRPLQGTFRFQVEPNWAHLDHFKELTA